MSKEELATQEFVLALEEPEEKQANSTSPRTPLWNTHYQNPPEAVAHSKSAGNIEGHSPPQKFRTVSDPGRRYYIWQQYCAVTFPLVTKLPCLMLNSFVTKNPNPNLSSFLFLHPALPLKKNIIWQLPFRDIKSWGGNIQEGSSR